ncbi:MAG: hypothetical protein HY657_17780 [Acidobacteria bacterium]|nr:hypothetical protein [Acidobacteriota bacterium]
MTRALIAAAGFIVLASGALAAAEFWDDKAFTAWSDKEVMQILSDSPWSRPVAVSLAPAGGDARGRRGGGRGGGGRGGRGAAPQLQLTVTWRTALPMKQALVRSQIGLNGAVPPEAEEMLARTEDAYAVTITGLPEAFAAAFDGAKAVTFLLREGKPPVPAEEILSAPQPGNTQLMLAVFPRAATIALEDNEVEFVTTLGPVEIKRKFTLQDMIFMGQLEL